MKNSLERFRRATLHSLGDEDTVDQALATALRVGVHHFPVLSSEGSLVGMVCTCDMSTRGRKGLVRDRMREPITLSLTHTCEDALELMNECAIGSILLLEDEAPKGIVTRGDLLASGLGAETLRELPRCSCCGTTEHLRTSMFGEPLCVACRKLPRGAGASVPATGSPSLGF